MRPVRRPLVAALAAPSERALDLTRRYFVLTHLDEKVKSVLQSMTPSLVAQMVRKNPQLTPQQRALLGQAAAEAEQDTAGRMLERLGPVFAERFTDSELQAIVAFYESAAGKALVARTPAFAAQMNPTLQALMPQMLADLNERFCAKAGCKLRPAPAASGATSGPSPARP